MKRRGFPVAAGLALALGSFAGPAAAQTDPDAAHIIEMGWWAKRPNPSVGEGGFEIAKDVNGASSVAALRISLGKGSVERATLVLGEASGVAQDTAMINVCSTTVSWKAAHGGAFAEAPAADCATPIALKRDAGAGNWTADLLPLLAREKATTASVVLVPGANEQLPVDPGFQVTFSGAQLLAANGEDDASTTSSGSDSGVGSSSGSGTIASSGSQSSTDTTITSGFVASIVTTAASSASAPIAQDTAFATTPAAEATAAPADAAATDTETVLQPLSLESDGAGAPWGRLILLLPIAALAGAAGVAARKRLSSLRPAD